ncbi:MAG: FkbM family methyltransferase [Bryobacteraceae bacterium]
MASEDARSIRHPFRWILLTLLLLVLGYTYFAKFRLGLLVLVGRSPYCTFSRAIEAADELDRQIAIKDRLVVESRKTEEDPKGYHRWHTPDGDFWIPAGSDYSLHYNLAEERRHIYGVGDQALREGDVVFDCGANIGVFTALALKAKVKRIIAIEPAPENLECFRRNFGGDIESGKIVLIPKGVWDKDDILTLNVDPKNSAADSFVLKPEGSVGKIQVPLTTIDKIVAQLGLDQVDFIKLDIEGAEANALRGAVETMRKFKPRVSVAAYHQANDPRQITNVVLGVGPDYKVECGPCSELNNGVRPDILWFR